MAKKTVSLLILTAPPRCTIHASPLSDQSQCKRAHQRGQSPGDTSFLRFGLLSRLPAFVDSRTPLESGAFGSRSEFTACQRLLLNCNKISGEWMGVENMVPSERNQTKKNMCHMIPCFVKYSQEANPEIGKQSHGFPGLMGKEER